MKNISTYRVLQLVATGVIIWLFGAGCEPAMQDGPVSPIEPVRGKQNIHEAVAALNAHRERIRPIRAGGNCRVEWYESDGTLKRENPAIQLRMVPPSRLYFVGEIIGSEVVQFGTNPQEFWFRLKPKEVSSYWWGIRETARKCRSGGMLNPESVLEALGIVDIDANWTLVGREGFDILTLNDFAGIPIKRVYVDWRDYLVRNIEYFDAYGEIVAAAGMSGYGEDSGGIPVPTQIAIQYFQSSGGSLSISMTLRGVRLFEPTEVQLKGLFARPSTDGFENIYVLADNCEFVRAE
ncbi:MAG: hypothetical protein IH624_11720 [Phycisphaerae bacterium]|nr:hypothetical protein [Phycisphaerae bacterium]